MWTPALMLRLTNPYAKRKVLSLTKPKGKIYKTKSLGHYIIIFFPKVLLVRREMSTGAVSISYKDNDHTGCNFRNIEINLVSFWSPMFPLYFLFFVFPSFRNMLWAASVFKVLCFHHISYLLLFRLLEICYGLLLDLLVNIQYIAWFYLGLYYNLFDSKPKYCSVYCWRLYP